MPKNKKSKTKELPKFATDAEAGFVDNKIEKILPVFKESEKKSDIREIARKAVIDKGVEPTEQRINDYIERFNLA